MSDPSVGPALGAAAPAAPDRTAPWAPAELSAEVLASARSLRADDGARPRLDELVGLLGGVDPIALEGDPLRLAFWINLYNARLLHELSLRPRSGHLVRHWRAVGRSSYRVGGLDFPLDVMEHGLLRRNARPPYGRVTLRAGDPRLGAMVSALDPRIHFALNCGARSCPPIAAYRPADIDAQLKQATRSYFASECELDCDRGVVRLPRLVRYYRADFGGALGGLTFAARHLPAADGAWVREHSERIRVRYSTYDWGLEPAFAGTGPA